MLAVQSAPTSCGQGRPRERPLLRGGVGALGLLSDRALGVTLGVDGRATDTGRGATPPRPRAGLPKPLGGRATGGRGATRGGAGVTRGGAAGTVREGVGKDGCDAPVLRGGKNRVELGVARGVRIGAPMPLPDAMPVKLREAPELSPEPARGKTQPEPPTRLLPDPPLSLPPATNGPTEPRLLLEPLGRDGSTIERGRLLGSRSRGGELALPPPCARAPAQGRTSGAGRRVASASGTRSVRSDPFQPAMRGLSLRGGSWRTTPPSSP